MLFRIALIILSLIFAGILEVSAFRDYWYFYCLGGLVAFSVLAVWPFIRRKRFLAIPFFLSVGSLNLLFLIDSMLEKQIFIILSTVVYYLALLGGYRLRFYISDQTAQGMLNLATLATVFFWYVANYGWFLNFAIPTWSLVATFIGSTFLLGLPSLMIAEESFCNLLKTAKERPKSPVFSENHQSNRQVVILLNFVLAFIMGEVIWALALWPFRYLATGVVALIIYFIFWDSLRSYIQNRFSRGTLIFNAMLATLCIIGMLITTQWSLAR